MNRPTPTTGLVVTCLTKATPASCQPSLRLCEYRPEWASSQPASPPLRCTASVIKALVRTSSSVHSRAEALGVVSEDGCTVHHSVHTTAQPPSAFIPRIAAWVRG